MENKKITSYSIYNEDAKKRTRHNLLDDLYPSLPNEKFDIIYADPPWDYNGKMQFDKSGLNENFDPNKKVFISSASFKYPTLKTNELKKLDVQSICADDALLFMWTTGPFLDQSIDLGQSWGFDYKTIAFVWNKMRHNPGQYTLSYCELCLVFKKGRIPKPRGARNIKQLVEIPRGEHSEKPLEVLQSIGKMFPTQRKIELFARSTEEGWTPWGLDSIVQHGERKTHASVNEMADSPPLQQKLF